MKQRKKKKTFGQEIVERLQEFVDVLESGADIEKTFTCHRVEMPGAPSDIDPHAVKQVRTTMKASQAVFARFLGVSVQTVRAWEQGTNVPSEMAKRFLDEIRHNPDYWRTRLHEMTVPKKHARAS
jgi:putative transcriptional regulator